MSIIFETNLPLKLSYRGKVRDTYDLGDKLLLVASDRISAFDFVLASSIPNKGLVLNQLSVFWFGKTIHILPNQVIQSIDTLESLKNNLPDAIKYPDQLIGRSMIVKKARRVPVEAVVRGYLSGSAWTEYRKSGTISGIGQLKGLNESQELPNPLFTPTTKADSGHDIPLTTKDLENLIGKITAQKLEEISLAIYNYARNYAKHHDIIIADTKFEFGFVNDELILIDELITPDSSRFWDASKYLVGQSQPSFDKQPVRDWLEATGWNKEPPAPVLPKDIIEKTTERYTTVFKKLTDSNLKIYKAEE